MLRRTHKCPMLHLIICYCFTLPNPVERKAGDTLGDFIRRSPRSAKTAKCARCSDCDFRRSPRSAYKIADIRHVRYRRLKPATHLAILFADRREFIASENRERFTPPTGCGHTWRFFSPIAATWHFNLVPRLQVPLLTSILKNHVIKSPNLIG